MAAAEPKVPSTSSASLNPDRASDRLTEALLALIVSLFDDVVEVESQRETGIELKRLIGDALATAVTMAAEGVHEERLPFGHRRRASVVKKRIETIASRLGISERTVRRNRLEGRLRTQRASAFVAHAHTLLRDQCRTTRGGLTMAEIQAAWKQSALPHPGDDEVFDVLEEAARRGLVLRNETPFGGYRYSVVDEQPTVSATSREELLMHLGESLRIVFHAFRQAAVDSADHRLTRLEYVLKPGTDLVRLNQKLIAVLREHLHTVEVDSSSETCGVPFAVVIALGPSESHPR